MFYKPLALNHRLHIEWSEQDACGKVQNTVEDCGL